jgi:hypothetical protein
VLDVNDLGRAVAFWADLLQSQPHSTSHETWVDVARLGEGGPVLTLQLVTSVKRSKNRLHLDLAVPDFLTARVDAHCHSARKRYQPFTSQPAHGRCSPTRRATSSA